MVTPEETPLKQDTVSKKKTLREKIKYVKDNITVEPVLACYVIPGALARLATQNLNLDKACRVNLSYGDEVCDALLARESNKYLKQELAVQQLVASMEVWKNILLTAIPCFLILFLGAWSDRTRKRKICIILPIVGDMLMCLAGILSVFFFYELPLQITMFLEAIFPAITGAWISVYMGVFSYISDISSEESRTFRIGVANLCLTAGGPIGSALSGVLLNSIGYYGVFSVSAALKLFSICYCFFYVHDPKRPDTDKDAKHESSHVCGFLKSFFDIKHVKDTLVVCFKKGPNNRRSKSIMVLACIVLLYGPAYGAYLCVALLCEFTVRYLFTRYRFSWDALKYSFYSTFYICVHALGALISISLFSRYFKWHDSVLGLISNFSKIAGAIAYSCAMTSLDMYLAVVIETFNATSFTALRSISSKLVTKDELGKMTSLFNMTENLASMVFGPLYSWIYAQTLSVDAGLTYYITTVLTIPPIFIFGWFFLQRKKENSQPEDDSDLKERKDDSHDPDSKNIDAGKDSVLSNIEIAELKVYTK